MADVRRQREEMKVTYRGVYLTTIPTAASVGYECNEYEAIWWNDTDRVKPKYFEKNPLR
jgi:hypothetical protein